MKHQVITLPEHHEHYPHLWLSECGTYRIIRCCDDIQFVFQQWRNPKWRHLSYHVEILFSKHKMKSDVNFLEGSDRPSNLGDCDDEY